MSLEGKAITEYASLSGKIHTIVIDATLSIGGACADAKATGEMFDKVDERIADAAEEAVRATINEQMTEMVQEAAEIKVAEEVPPAVAKAIADMTAIPTETIQAICT